MKIKSCKKHDVANIFNNYYVNITADFGPDTSIKKQSIQDVVTKYENCRRIIGFGARGGGGEGGHFELQPLVCSGKVITLTQHTQQCITQVTKLTTNSQQDP